MMDFEVIGPLQVICECGHVQQVSPLDLDEEEVEVVCESCGEFGFVQ